MCVGHYGLSTFGMQFVDSGLLSVLVYTMPIINCVLAHFFGNERLTTNKVFELIVGAIGLIIILWPKFVPLKWETMWHAAYYMVFLPDKYFETLSRSCTLLMGCVLMVCWTVMYVEIYRLTKSVWPCVLMHSLEDAVPTVLVATSTIISFTKKADVWLNPISGVIATVLFLGIGLLLRSIRRKRDGIGTNLSYNFKS